MQCIAEFEDDGIAPGEMEDGDIGVITIWSRPQYVGAVVQRVGGLLVRLGASTEHHWSTALSRPGSTNRVRLLQRGDKIVLV